MFGTFMVCPEHIQRRFNRLRLFVIRNTFEYLFDMNIRALRNQPVNNRDFSGFLAALLIRISCGVPLHRFLNNVVLDLVSVGIFRRKLVPGISRPVSFLIRIDWNRICNACDVYFFFCSVCVNLPQMQDDTICRTGLVEISPVILPLLCRRD